MKKILPNTIYGPCSDCATETLILILYCSSNHTCCIVHNMMKKITHKLLRTETLLNNAII